jgi:hypothetical protein
MKNVSDESGEEIKRNRNKSFYLSNYIIEMKATEVRARDSYKECVSIIKDMIAGEHKH